MNEPKRDQIQKQSALVSLLTGKRKFLINPPFQLKFMASLIGLSLLGISLIFLANNYFFHTYIERGQAMHLAPDHPYFLMIHEQKQFLTNVYFIVASAISFFSCMWGLFYSHKIAGPLYRLHRYFQDAAKEGQGLKKKISFREDDFFQEIPDSINKVIQSENLQENSSKYSKAA